MSMTIAGFVAAVAEVAGALAEIKDAPTKPPESIDQYPFAITYPGATDVTGAANPQTKRLVTVICEIHCGRSLLPAAVEQATPYGDSFPIALWGDPRLGGAVNHINSVRGDFLSFDYAGSKSVGWRFTIVAKQED